MSQKPNPRRSGSSAGAQTWRARLRTLWLHHGPASIRPRRLLVAVLCILAYTALLEVDLFQAGISWPEGSTADRDVIADRTVEFIDESATDEARQAAAAAVAEVYDTLPVQGEAETKLRQLFADVRALPRDPAFETIDQQVAELRRRLFWTDLEPTTLRWLLTMPPEQLNAVGATAQLILSNTYRNSQIRDNVPSDLEARRNYVDEQVQALVQDPENRRFLRTLLTEPDILKPNQRYNEEETEKQREVAAEKVQPVKRTIPRGTVIVKRGYPVTPEIRADLEGLGLIQPRRDWKGLFALMALVTLTLIILGTYIQLELPHVFYDDRRLVLLNLLAMLALLMFRFLIWLKAEVPSFSHPAILCGAATGMVVAVLIEYRLAMMMTGALALFLGVIQPASGLWIAFEAWLAGRVGAMALRHVKDRNDLARAGLVVAVAGMLIAAVTQLPRSGEATLLQTQHLSTDMLFGFGWGLLAFLIAQGLIPLLERPFSCVTPFRLLELTNTSTPVLQELKRRARGSFDASLTIGDMAADASEAIGADPLLARAAGYHHDIGKMKHPSWFIENQFGGENVHDKLKPTFSAMAIKSHVSDGAQIARSHGLPEPLIDVILQHHGTTQISFFYYQALEQAAEGEKVPEDQFRYEGPRPQFKESGIIMLADGIEAAVRAASMHGSLSERKISEIVSQLIKRRLEEGQLDECDLTLRELNIAANAFIDFLRGMYHGRIDYPPQALKAKAKAKKDD